MKKILITGAMGFLGSKLAQKFCGGTDIVEGWDIVSGNNGSIDVKKIDMGNEEEVLSHLEVFAPDVVIHCAGSADVAKSVEHPEIDYNGNVTLTHHLLFGLHKLGLGRSRFIFLSSAAVYGNPRTLPIREDMELQPLSPYALHKVMCEDICRYFFRNYGMDIKIARVFSAYGRGLKKQIFWDMYHKYGDTGRLDMFGTGQESRDYIHLEDVIQALYLLTTVESDDMIFNVANGEEVTIRTVTEYFAECAGAASGDISFNGVVREGDPLNWRADISKIRALGYQKSVEMKDGIKDYYEWVSRE